MRKMFSQKQIEEMITHIDPDVVVSALVGKDINVEGITSKGIANTGGIANIGDVVVSGDITAQGEGKGNIVGNTLKQLHANKVFDISVSGYGNLTYSQRFARAEILNNILYMILSYQIENETEADISATYINFDIEVDDDTGDKIYCTDGSKLSDAYTTTKLICGYPAFRGGSLSGANNGDVRKIAKNKMRISISTGVAIQAHSSQQYEGRNFLVLL